LQFFTLLAISLTLSHKIFLLKPKKIVITGGPSTGKTSIIEKIELMGHACIHEISRSITLEAREQGIQQLFVSDPLLFSKKITEGRINQFHEASKFPVKHVFMDRGLPDVVAYMDCFGQEYDHSFIEACENYIYDDVFLLPPWKEIYSTDEERYENFDEALRIHDCLETSYKKYGYKPKHVPKGTIAERLSFILNKVKN
jgi:predicted ATPase